MKNEEHRTKNLFCVLCSVFFVSGAALPHERITTKITWSREVAPIVQARCGSCHAPGGPAPMSLVTYEDARPWAKAIKEEVLARRMPKWANVRGYGDFSNDPSLSAFEIALVAAWADGGAPRGESADAGKAPASAGREIERPRTRSVDVPCAARALPAGRLMALKPMLSKGESLRVTLVHADGMQEPLLWVRDFDPKFADTYWLRAPVNLTSRTRLQAEGFAPCTLTALLAARTGK